MPNTDSDLNNSHHSPNHRLHRPLGHTESHPNNLSVPTPNTVQLNHAINLDDNIPPIPPSPTPSLNINRPVYSVREFNENYILDEGKKSIKEKIRKYKPDLSKKAWLSRMNALFPITSWLPKYDVRQNLVADILVGITIASFQVPQSMGYALIAHVHPVFGLYTAFFPALMYTILGTSFHSSIGPVAIVAGLMTGNIVVDVSEDLGRSPDEDNPLINRTQVMAGFEDVTNMDIALMVAVINGIYLLVFGVLRLGFINNYLSEELVSGFMTSAALHVFTAQVHYLTGVHLDNYSGIFALPNTYIEFFSKITEVNLTALVISLVCIAILIFFKLCVEKLFHRMGLKLPFPIHLFIMIGGCVASYLMGLRSNQTVEVVGEIPNRFEMPSLPKFKLFTFMWLRCIPTAVVTFTQTLSVGRLYGAKYNYNIESNQETVALGVSNIWGSFFKCLPCSASIPRSAVQEAGGGKTQVVSLVNCTCILVVILVLSSLLQDLPNCVLAACIAVALGSIISKFQDFLHYWSISKIDAAIWMITFLGVVFLNVDYGIYIGFGCSLLLLIYKSQRPKTYLLGSVDNSDIYVPIFKFQRARELRGIKIYLFCGPLNFANCEYFRNELQSRTGIDVRLIKEEMSKMGPKSGNCFSLGDKSNDNPKQVIALEDKISKSNLPKFVIIDCSMLSYIDTAGVTALKKLVQTHSDISIQILLTGCHLHIENMLKKDGFFKEVSSDRVFKSVHDAVTYIRDIDPTSGWPIMQKNEQNRKMHKVLSNISLESNLSLQTVSENNEMTNTLQSNDLMRNSNGTPTITRDKKRRSVSFAFS